MYKKIVLAAFAAINLGSAEAVVVVNGVAGEDADGLPPFRTIQAALDYANNNGDPVVDIQTTRPNFLGASLRGKELNLPITIQNSSATTITTGLDLLPTTGTHLITLKNLNVSTTGLGTPLIVGTSITADDCIFNANPAGGGAYGPAVTAAVESNTTTATLTMTSCTMIGHIGLQAGRAARDYILTRCVAVGQTTDLPPQFAQGINNNMNWFSSYAFRMGAANGFQEITEPRALTLNQCLVRGGVPLAWPTTTLDASYYQQENSTIGPVTATNTVFDALNINGPGEANRLNHPSLPPNQDIDSMFIHCTFRSANAWGLFYFFGGQPTTYTWTNCLFDMMLGNYGIGVDPGAAGSVTLAGDGNAYHVPSGNELYPYGSPAFETSKHLYIGNTAAGANLTDSMGSLLYPHEDVVAEAIVLIPPVLTDKDRNPRPMPVSALFSDIGADEVDETAPSAVRDWSLY
jgi:hypothetical protein